MQISALEGAKPTVEADLARFLEEIERSRGEVEVLIANAREEARLIEALKNQQIENRDAIQYRVIQEVSDLGWVDLVLGSSPGW